MAPRVVVFDYGSGNVHSALKAVEAAGASVTLTHDRNEALEAEGLLVPGVGAFATVMEGLRQAQGDGLIEKRLAGGRPVMGICVGLQVMCEEGLEHGVRTEGLGQWPGQVQKLDAPILPHMGWNTVDVGSGSILFEGIEQERFYFVHSYALTDWSMPEGSPLAEPVVTWSEHGEKFVAAVENGALSATQFHPEKSGPAGIHLLRNWVRSLSDS